MMAIGKWIPFATQQSASASQSTKPQPVTVLSSANTKKFGLENFGNTCYANSVLQALYFCAPFRELVIQYADPSALLYVPQPQPQSLQQTPSAVRWKTERKISQGQTAETPIPTVVACIPSTPPTLFSALRSLFLFISKNPADKGTVAPRAFIEKLKEVNELFRSTMHQDAHEFLNYLLNKIVEEMEQERKHAADDLSNSVGTLQASTSSNSGTSPQNGTLVHRLFEGVLTSETRCLTCETISSRDEAFLDLSVDIEQHSSITACLRQFSASEMLCHKNKFFCDSCCDLQEAEKRMKIKKLPNILALHLKRFKYQEDLQKYIKLAYRVAFPLELRLFNTVDDTEDADRLFSLFAIVVHIGIGPHHGHYISIVKTMGSWLVFDDDSVEPIRESDIPKYFGDSNAGSAYVLYYQAVDLDLAALGLQTTPPEPANQASSSLQPTEPAGSPQVAPALPPGLSEEADSSDLSDPPFPPTPAAPPSIPLVPLRRVSGEGVTVKVTSPDDTNSSSSYSTSQVLVKGAGILKSLRRAQSTKSSSTSASDQPPIVPRKSEEQTPPVPAMPNGKDKEKSHPTQGKDSERWPTAWFHLKGSRGEKARMLVEPSSPRRNRLHAELDDRPQTAAASTDGSRASGSISKNDKDRVVRRPSEPGLFELSVQTAFGITTPNGGGLVELPPRRQFDRANGYDSHSAGSAASSVASAPPFHGVDLPSTSSSRSSPQRSSHRSRSPSRLRTDPSSQDSETVPSSAIPVDKPKQSTSQPALPSPPARMDSRRRSGSPPPPPPKSLPACQENGKAMGGHSRDGYAPSDELADEWQTLEKMSSPESQGIGAFPIADRSVMGASASLKHATRKLSLTVGFGRKDKEKRDRGRAQDKLQHASSNSFVGFSSART